VNRRGFFQGSVVAFLLSLLPRFLQGEPRVEGEAALRGRCYTIHKSPRGLTAIAQGAEIPCNVFEYGSYKIRSPHTHLFVSHVPSCLTDQGELSRHETWSACRWDWFEGRWAILYGYSDALPMFSNRTDALRWLMAQP
jgi:hypothetical protein